jgi:hypothetical protein
MAFYRPREHLTRRWGGRHGGELFQQLPCALDARGWIDLDQALDGTSERIACVGRRLDERSPVSVEDFLHGLHVVHAIERAEAAERLEHDHAEGEQICSAVDGLPTHSFGRHVWDLALSAAARRDIGAVDRRRDSEVRKLGVARAAQQDVRRRDVTVDQGTVRMLERVRQIHCDEGDDLRRQAFVG